MKSSVNKEEEDGGQCMSCVHACHEARMCVCVRETLEIITIDFYPWDVEMLPDGCRMIMAQTYRLFTG